MYHSSITDQRIKKMSIAARQFNGDPKRLMRAANNLDVELEDQLAIAGMLNSIPTPEEKQTVDKEVDQWLKDNPDMSLKDVPMPDRLIYQLKDVALLANQLTVIYRALSSNSIR